MTRKMRPSYAAKLKKLSKDKDGKPSIKATQNVSESKPIKKPKTKSTGAGKASQAKDLNSLAREINEINADLIRKEMKRDPHVLVINKAQFTSLIKDHFAELRRAASKTEDENLKKLLFDSTRGNKTKLAGLLMKEFIKILDKHLRRVKKFDINKEIRSSVVLYYFSPKVSKDPNNPTVGGTNVFDILRDTVFSNIRQELVYNSKAGTTGRFLSIVIAGLDIDYDEITKGLGAQAKEVELQNAPVSKSGERSKGAGIQLGHFRGGATVAAAKSLQAIRKAQSGIVGLTGFWFKAKGYHDLIHEADAEVRFNDVVYKRAQDFFGKDTVDITIIGLEQTAKNSISGSFTRQKLKDMLDWIRKNSAVILTAKGSKPLANIILDDVIRTFLDQKQKTRRINRKGRNRKKTKMKTPGVELAFNTKSNTEKLATLTAQNTANYSPENLQAIIELINHKLHDKIQQNMGKGSSKQILNYRTGRFAKSAKVQMLYDINQKNALGASVKYMRHPYGVFEPGGRLHKPGRDPHRIFGKSIRQILQEQKLGHLRRVIVDLDG